MITDVPSPDDFTHAGVAFLNLAWNSVLDMALELAVAEEGDSDGTVADEYWAAAQRPLATATTLVHQGTEFLLKSRITAVSPFLLLDGNPKDWPRACHRNDTPFSAFKTIDAQDLLRAHDTVAATRLSEEFVNRYEHLRQLRNTVMHTVDPHLRFTATDLVLAILEISEALVRPQAWTELRRDFLESEPTSVAHSPDHVEPSMARECLKVIDLLQPSQLRRFFGFNTRQRRYLCPHCQVASRDWESTVNTAQLRPNTAASRTVYCFVCRRETAVARRDCPEDDCRGNVIDADDNTCLSCWN